MDLQRPGRRRDGHPEARTGTGPAGPRTARPAGEPAPAAAGERTGRNRLSLPGRRPALYLATALLAVAGLVLVTSDPLPAQASSTETSGPGTTSVAEELGLRRAAASVLSEDEAATRLQETVASRAEREDARAAAAQVQADAEQSAAAAAAEAARPRIVVPVAGARISSGFGTRWGTLHAGVDFAAPMGTPEYAAMDGVVLRAGPASGFGLAVYIQHANGDVTVYGHMEQILVQEGQTVKAGDTIALLGMRGQSTGPHLHFEVHVGGIDGPRIDPLPWLREHGLAI